MRLDRYLWFARVTRKREWAQAMATSGHLRIDGRAVGEWSLVMEADQWRLRCDARVPSHP